MKDDVLSFRDIDLKETLEKMAKERGVSVSELLRYFVEKGMEYDEKRNKIGVYKIKNVLDNVNEDVGRYARKIKEIKEWYDLKKELEERQGIFFTDPEIAKSLKLVKKRIKELMAELPDIKDEEEDDWFE